MNDSFGAAFGRHVKAKRAETRLTQGQLAARVWPGDSDAEAKRKADISKLETGKVANPHTTTVKRIADALGISDEEIDALRKQAQMSPQEQLDNVPTLSRGQLELLAHHFGHEAAYDARDAALREFLTKKAEEYRGFKQQIDALDDRIPAIHNLKGAAQDAAARLDFDEVESLLSRVDEVETEIAAETKEARARNALLRGRAEQAYDILSAAADSFASTDPLEPARRRLRYQSFLWEYGLRHAPASFLLMQRMASNALSSFEPEQDPHLFGLLNVSLANAYQRRGINEPGVKGVTLLEESVHHYRAAMQYFSESAGKFIQAMTIQNLAVSLKNLAHRLSGEDAIILLDEAVDSYRVALSNFVKSKYPLHWSRLTQNLAQALERKVLLSDSCSGASIAEEVVELLRDALNMLSATENALDWAAANLNLGNALLSVAKLSDSATRTSLLSEAVEKYRAVLQVYTEAVYPVEWAKTINNLGVILIEQGSSTAGEAGTALLAEAAENFRAALRVRTEAEHPVNWARTRENIALLEEAWADHDSCADPRPHLEAALAHVEAALTVYDPEHMPYDHGTATDLRDRLRARLAALGGGGP